MMYYLCVCVCAFKNTIDTIIKHARVCINGNTFSVLINERTAFSMNYSIGTNKDLRRTSLGGPLGTKR